MRPRCWMSSVGGHGVLGIARQLAELHTSLAEAPLPEIDLEAPFGEPSSLLHLDLHPDNVMLTDRGRW